MRIATETKIICGDWKNKSCILKHCNGVSKHWQYNKYSYRKTLWSFALAEAAAVNAMVVLKHRVLPQERKGASREKTIEQ